MASILSRDRIDILQYLNSPHCHITQIPNRRTDEIKSFASDFIRHIISDCRAVIEMKIEQSRLTFGWNDLPPQPPLERGALTPALFQGEGWGGVKISAVTPKCLWVGIGCQRGVSKLAIQRAIESVFTEYNLDLATIAGLATIDRKANELGLLEYCRESDWFLKTYSPERLNSVTVHHPSQLVSTLVGVKSVAEAAALSAAQTTILLVPKQKFRLDPDSAWVTVAIARIERHNCC